MYIYLKAHITAMTLTHGELNLTNYSPYTPFTHTGGDRVAESGPQLPAQQNLGATFGLCPSADPRL